MMMTAISKKEHQDLVEEVRSLGFNARATVTHDGHVYVGDFLITEPCAYDSILKHFLYIHKYEKPYISIESLAAWYVKKYMDAKMAIDLLVDRPSLLTRYTDRNPNCLTILAMVRVVMAEALVTHAYNS